MTRKLTEEQNLLLNTDRYFNGCNCISNIEEYQCNGAVSRECDSVAENLSRSEGRSDNLYRAFTSATPLERSWINIRWLISFRADRNVAFLKFSANCPRAVPRPRPLFLFLLSPSFQSSPRRAPAGFFILFPDGGFPARYSHSGSHPVYTARAALLAASREIISKNICGIDVAIIIAKRMALNCRMRPPHVLPCDESIYIVHYIYIVAGAAGAENLSRREYSKNANYRYCSLFLFILLQVWLAIPAVDLSLMYY